MNKTIVLFEDAIELALKIVKPAADISHELTLVRDLRGRIRLLLPGSKKEHVGEKESRISTICRELSKTLGPYGFPSERSVLYEQDLFQDNSQFIAQDRILIFQKENFAIFLLDRQITGQDWLKKPFTRTTTNPRVTFFGIKGGVGRSTALIIWSWWLAKQGKKVLVFDLDLESPGVSSTLLPQESLPDFGIVDWFVEDGVGQADAIESKMVASSPLAQGLSGEIRIVPAYGAKTKEYLPKLSRCYADSVEPTTGSWGDRLERFVDRIEKNIQPDIVILDSRAGIHDIAATAITRMDAQILLFAVDSLQTWKAYEFLFHHWKDHPDLCVFREKLQIVASMIPETGRKEYLRRFRLNSWDLFLKCFYDPTGPEISDAFSFDLTEEDSPHNPLPIFWSRALQEFNPLGTPYGIEEKTATEAMDDFMSRVRRFVFEQE